MASSTLPGSESRGGRRTIAVVIGWVNPFELLAAGLDALQRGRRKPDEVIVVTRHARDAQDDLRRRYPGLRVLGAPPGTPITALRSIGIKASGSDVIVITEDHCVPSAGWLAAVDRRIDQGFDVVGGPVENAADVRLRDWAAFLTEYAFAIRSKDVGRDDGERGAIPGNNAAYRRELIGALCDALDANLWESFCYDRLRNEGRRFVHDSGMLVHHRRPFDLFYFVDQRFQFCRSFAGMRCRSLHPIGRIAYGLGSIVLPPVLWLRALRILAAKRRFVARFLLCSPLVALYLVSGACGEMVGYLIGAGDSLAKVE